jgi:FkbM family methyltransferase
MTCPAKKTDTFVQILRDHGADPRLIYDVGSFDAQQAVELSIAFRRAIVFAFEADPFNMQKCLGNARGHPRVKPVNLAIGEGAGIGIFNRAVGENDQCGSFLVPNGAFPQHMPIDPIYVPVSTAYDLMIRTGIPLALWMDVQGCEFMFFAGHGLRPKFVWMEVAYRAYYHNQPLKPEVNAAMVQWGYEPVYEGPGMEGWFGDICYVHKS